MNRFKKLISEVEDLIVKREGKIWDLSQLISKETGLSEDTYGIEFFPGVILTDSEGNQIRVAYDSYLFKCTAVGWKNIFTAKNIPVGQPLTDKQLEELPELIRKYKAGESKDGKDDD